MLIETLRRIDRSIRGSLRPVPPVDYKLLAENSLDLIVRCGRDQVASYASPSVLHLLGITPEEIVGRSHLSYVLAEDLPALHAVIERHLAGEQNARATFRMRRKDGGIVWVEGHGRMVGDGEAADVHFVVVMRDITAHKELEARLEALALVDGLTGVANRRAFDDRLAAEWAQACDTGQPLAMLMVDVDRFKTFNDDHGHQAGDECLRRIALCLAAAVGRPRAFVARYGGEEMAVILPGVGPPDAIAIGRALCAAVADLGIARGNGQDKPVVTVSIGAASTIPHEIAPNGSARLVRAADEALYAAKRSGRNRADYRSPAPSDRFAPLKLVA